MLTKVSAQIFILVYCLCGAPSTEAWFLNDLAGGHTADVFASADRFRDLESLETELAPEVSVPAPVLPNEKENANKEIIAADLLSSLLRGGLGLPHGLSFLKQITKQPWWKGPEVCVSKVEQVVNNSQSDAEPEKSPFIFLGNAAFSTCRNTLNKYICTNKVYTREETKTTEVTYQCCPGARKNFETEQCEHVDVKPLVETAKSLNASEFAKVMNSQVKKSVMEAPNTTIFVPSDDALNSYLQSPPASYMNEIVVHAPKTTANKSADDSSENEIPSDKVEKAPINLGNAISSERALNHLVPGVHDMHDMENEEILKTFDGLPIRINIYHGERRPTITANCAIVKSVNHPIVNGSMLHVTDAVLPQVTKSIGDILLESKDFGTFTNFVATADLMDKLSEPGNYTVFAFTDAAFNKVDEDLKSKLLKGKSCMKTLMKAHVIPRTLCSGAFGRLTIMTRSLSGNWVTIERTENDTLQVGRNSETTTQDIVASNGVLHVIDYPIIPKSAEPVNALLTKKNQTKWLDLMKKAGLADEFDDSVNRTLFVPTDEAVEKANLEQLDADKLKEIVSLHISDTSVCSCQMRNNLTIPTLLPDQELRVTTYETSGALFVGLDPKIMVQCASIVEMDEKACDTMVHEIDKVLTPTKQTIVEKIQEDPAMSKLKELFTNTTIYEELKNGSLGPITLLAPTEKAFGNLTKEDWKILEDKAMVEELLRRHIITDVVCCEGVGMTTWPFSEEVSTANGFSMNVRRKNRRNVIFGETTTESCDHLTKDGIIHYVDKVMMPRPINLKGSAVKYMDPSGSEIVLFGI